MTIKNPKRVFKAPSTRKNQALRSNELNMKFFQFNRDEKNLHIYRTGKFLRAKINCYNFKETIDYCKWLLEKNKNELNNTEDMMIEWYNHFIIEKKSKINLFGENRINLMYGSMVVEFKRD
jgi:hypothetical protein